MALQAAAFFDLEEKDLRRLDDGLLLTVGMPVEVVIQGPIPSLWPLAA